jgi:alginate O-acetyltransferase complex protein AlgI
MLFNSYEFIFVFLPVAFAGFFLIARLSFLYAALWLGLASLVFYGYWNPKYVGLLLASILFNYLFGFVISRAAGWQRSLALAFAIGVNLALLAYYKYADFFITSTNDIAGTQWSTLGIILPLGISFFTFTQISFLVDVHRGITREYNFYHYLLFVTYFPHLIAGPVLHHKQMMPQFAEPETYRLNPKNIAIGLTIFAIGLSKKVLIADNLAPSANRIFSAAEAGVVVTFFDAWAGALAYTFQLYFDFSGYSDMAIGLALLFNVRMPLNFDAPYRATSIADFWRRWHISLSNFLRDYLYVPLGGNRRGNARRYLNLLITMVLGGLWHGAAWTFVLWGALHGALLAINHLWRDLKRRLGWRDNHSKLAVYACWALTFLFVVVAWVIFKAETLSGAKIVLAGLFGLNGVSLPETLAASKPVARIANALSINVSNLGLVPLLDTGGNLYREFRIYVVIAAVIAFAIPLIDTASKKALELVDTKQGGGSLTTSRYARIFGSFYAAIAAGLLLGFALASIRKDTPFLYFQF